GWPSMVGIGRAALFDLQQLPSGFATGPEYADGQWHVWECQDIFHGSNAISPLTPSTPASWRTLAGMGKFCEMARFTHRQLLVRRHISDIASRALDPMAMGRTMLTALEEVVHADHGGLGTVDPASLLANRALAIWPGTERSTMVLGRRGVLGGLKEISSDQLVSAFFGSTYLRDPEPLMLWPSQLRAGLTLVIRPQTEKSLGLPPPFMQAALSNASREWYEAASPVGGTLRTGLWTDGRCVGALAIGRDDPEGSFRPSEVAFVRAVSPTIARGLRLALDRESMAAATEDGRKAPGLMLLDRHGRPVYVSPAGRQWLNVLESVAQVGKRQPSPAVLSPLPAP